MRCILNLLYIIVSLLYSPVIIYRAIKHKRYRDGWAQRFGKISRENPGKKCIWIHAVSVGEVNAARTVIKKLKSKFNDFKILISTTTDTGQLRAKKLFSAEHKIIYFPFDFSWVMSRAFKNINPAICLLMELEVWPNFVDTAARMNIPVVIVNGRISDKSISRYRKIKPLVKGVFGKISLALAQTQEYAERFKEIGVPENNVVVTGSLKYDTAEITDKVEGSDILAEQLQLSTQNSKLRDKLWIAGATGPGEEQIILDVFKELHRQEKFSDLKLVVVPRKPERFDEVAQLITNSGFDFIRYSTIKTQDPRPKAQNLELPVILGDTMGDLRKFYSLSTIIFVGRSLVPMGGSDMMEAAALGKCTIFGPHTFNFKQTVDALLEKEGAILVNDKNELLQTMKKCLDEPQYAQKIAQNGQKVIKNNQGATLKTIEHIEKILNGV